MLRKLVEIAVNIGKVDGQFNGHLYLYLTGEDGLLLRNIRTIDKAKGNEFPFRLPIPRNLRKKVIGYCHDFALFWSWHYRLTSLIKSLAAALKLFISYVAPLPGRGWGGKYSGTLVATRLPESKTQRRKASGSYEADGESLPGREEWLSSGLFAHCHNMSISQRSSRRRVEVRAIVTWNSMSRTGS